MEIKKTRSQWVFSYDAEDMSQFDEGATNMKLHKNIYSESTGEGAPTGGFYAQYYKFHNNTQHEYFHFTGHPDADEAKVESPTKTKSAAELKASGSKDKY